MRLAAILSLFVGCSPAGVKPPTTPTTPAGSVVPRLQPPAQLDPAARGAAYLSAVALQLQPGWGQFLNDCRLRLPPEHSLNTMTLAATAELAIDRRGAVTMVAIDSSGNPEFDRAVRDAVTDASPVPAPPRELWSDDDQLHVRWMFARDRRQAGPATAQIVDVDQPLPAVVERRIEEHDLARAVQRLLRAPDGPERIAAGKRIAIAGLREALASSDGTARRAAVESIEQVAAVELTAAVQQLVAVTSDRELRLAAMPFVASEVLVAQLKADLKEDGELALAAATALARRSEQAAAAAVIQAELDGRTAAPNPIALQALGIVSITTLAPKLGPWFASGDVRVRAGVCAALAQVDPDLAWPVLARGFKDRDATVRATCLHEARSQRALPKARAAMSARSAALATLRRLVQDRDRTVRARAVIAAGVLDPDRLPDASADQAAEVRAAYATALANARPQDVETRLRTLVDDRDAEVRTAAWHAYIVVSTNALERRTLAQRGATDSAPSVRRAAIPAIDDDETLRVLATTDVAPEVRTAAFVRLAQVRTRAAIGDMLLQRFAMAGPGSAERVRTALAWLLTR